VDVHLIPDAEPTEAERDALDSLIGAPLTRWEGSTGRTDSEGHMGRGGHEQRSRRHLLLPALEAVQSRIGYISPGAMNYLCRRMGVAPAEVYGVASFYALLATGEHAPCAAHVCDDIACRLRGGLELCDALEQRIGPPGTPALDGRVTWHRSPCLGLCERAPAVLVQQAGDVPVEVAVAPIDTPTLLSALATGAQTLAAESGGVCSADVQP
jgi:NADH-quinone oxidoreductase subunit F